MNDLDKRDSIIITRKIELKEDIEYIELYLFYHNLVCTSINDISSVIMNMVIDLQDTPDIVYILNWNHPCELESSILDYINNEYIDSDIEYRSIEDVICKYDNVQYIMYNDAYLDRSNDGYIDILLKMQSIAPNVTNYRYIITSSGSDITGYQLDTEYILSDIYHIVLSHIVHNYFTEAIALLTASWGSDTIKAHDVIINKRNHGYDIVLYLQYYI